MWALLLVGWTAWKPPSCLQVEPTSISTDLRTCSTRYERGELTVVIEPHRLVCSACGSADVTRSGGRTRRWRHLPIGLRPSFIEVHVPRLACRACGLTRQFAVGFAEPDKRHTRGFAEYVIALSHSMTISDLATTLRAGRRSVAADRP